jgi:inner membrane protein
MDNLTHTLTGLVLSRVGLDRWCGRASALLILAANAPDIDVIAAAHGGTVTYLEHHRGLTHSFVMAPAMALLVVAVVGLAVKGRNMQWARSWVLAQIGVLSHLLMDWTNIYGIRLLWPFDSVWYRLDIVSVIDPWIWAVLALAFLWPLLARLVSSEIGAQSRAGRGIAWFALLFIVGYEFSRWVLHARAVETLDVRIYQGQPPKRSAAFPSLANPFRWRGLVEIDNAYVIHAVNLMGEFDPTSGTVLYQADSRPELEAARQTRAFQVFTGFAPYPLWQVLALPEPEGAVRVNGVDLRFAMPGEGRFMASAIVEGGRLTRSWFQFSPAGDVPRPR